MPSSPQLVSALLREAEVSVGRASDWLTRSQDVEDCSNEIDNAADRLAIIAREHLNTDASTRLLNLRKELGLLQATLKYGLLLRAGLEQVDAIGYTPAGLERTL